MSSNLGDLLGSWRKIAEFARSNVAQVALFIDHQAPRMGTFLQRFNMLRPEFRQLFAPFIFGREFIGDWRPVSISANSTCQLATEQDLVQDSGVCEAYEHSKSLTSAALFGHVNSSYANRQTVGVTKVQPQGPLLEMLCGVDVADIRRIGILWGCCVLDYDSTLNRTPRDAETVFGREPERFVRVGRVERNGRRQVFRELATNRLFYVDNLHVGQAAHLEVFDANEQHIGTADLDGTIRPDTRIRGRVISW